MRTIVAVAMTVAIIAPTAAPAPAQPAPQSTTSHIKEKASAARAAKPDQTIHANTRDASHAAANMAEALFDTQRDIIAHIMK